MNSAKLHDWLQIAGMFAVVASLIFVGLQIRQTDKIALSQIYHERAMAARETNLAAAENPFYLTGLAKLYTGKHEQLTAQEAIALELDLGGQLYVDDNYLLQKEMGYFPEEYWVQRIADIQCQFEHSFYRKVIVGWHFRAEFQELLDELTAAAIENPTGCWDIEFDYPIAE